MVVLIIGLGSISKKHISALYSICENPIIIALRSGNSKDDIEGITSIKKIDELTSKPDFAIISNPTFLHFETIEMLLDYKIPLFIEKPATHKISGTETLIQTIKRHGTINYVACNLRFHPCIIYLKKILISNSRRINEVNVYSGSYLPSWRPGVDFRSIYSSNKFFGGGVHLDLVHELDYSLWLFGQPIDARSFFSSKSSLKIDAIDYANYILEYNDFQVSVILNYYRKDSKRSIEIVFDDDTWIVNLLNSRIQNKNGDIIYFTDNYSIIDTYKDQMKYFVEHLQNQKQPMNSLEESINILKIALKNE
jgi:predicted dehydrogenase